MPMTASSVSGRCWFGGSSFVTKFIVPRHSQPHTAMCGKDSLTKFLHQAPSLSTHRSKGRHDGFISQVCSRNIHPCAPASQTWTRSDDSMSFPSDKMLAGQGGRNPKPWQRPGRPSIPVLHILSQWVEMSTGAHDPGQGQKALCSDAFPKYPLHRQKEEGMLRQRRYAMDFRPSRGPSMSPQVLSLGNGTVIFLWGLLWVLFPPLWNGLGKIKWPIWFTPVPYFQYHGGTFSNIC